MKKLLKYLLHLLGYDLIRWEKDYNIDVAVNEALNNAAKKVFELCPDPHFSKEYYKHQISSWGPIPALIYQFQLENKNQMTQPKMLDIGCAFGTMLVYCKNLGFDVTGIDCVDVDKYLGQPVRDKFNVNYLKLFIEKDQIPLGNEIFDIVTMTEVIEHFKTQPATILRKVVSLIRPNGYLYLTTPKVGIQWLPTEYNFPFEKIPNYVERNVQFEDKHWKHYSKDEIWRMLNMVGLRDVWVGVYVSPYTRLEGLYAFGRK